LSPSFPPSSLINTNIRPGSFVFERKDPACCANALCSMFGNTIGAAAA